MFEFFKKRNIINNYQQILNKVVKDIGDKYGDNWQIRTMITDNDQIMIHFGVTRVISLKPIPPFDRSEDFEEDQVSREVDLYIKRAVEAVKKQALKELGYK